MAFISFPLLGHYFVVAYVVIVIPVMAFFYCFYLSLQQINVDLFFCNFVVFAGGVGGDSGCDDTGCCCRPWLWCFFFVCV